MYRVCKLEFKSADADVEVGLQDHGPAEVLYLYTGDATP
jgi:hypothetical protein